MKIGQIKIAGKRHPPPPGGGGGHSPHEWLPTRVQSSVERVCFSEIGVVNVFL